MKVSLPMSKIYKLKKGLTIPLKGEAEKITQQLALPKTVAIKPTDFHGLVPKLVVKEGDKVLAGDALFVDKFKPEVQFTSPVSGSVLSIVRGDKRKLLEVVVSTQESIEYKKFTVPAIESASAEEIIHLLLEAGLWPFIKQRPFNEVADPQVRPKAIFVSGFDTAPLAPDYPFIISEHKDAFAQGMSVLTRLTEGKVHLNIFNEQRALQPYDTCCNNVQKNYFSGQHPVGNVGIQIHHLDPINKGEVVWTLNPQDVIFIGRFFATGEVRLQKTVAITGNVAAPKYVKTIVGVQIENCLTASLPKNQRIISGNVLTGTAVGLQGYLGFFDSQITIIPEGDTPQFMGWLAPNFEKFSLSRSFFSWLQKSKKFNLNTNLNGGERAFVFTGVYEKVLPMDVYPMQLLKAIIINDVDQMEQLGIYEIVEEDFALCEFVCPSKIEIQSLIREGLDIIKKEFS